MSSIIIITGVPRAPGQDPPPRREIHDLINDRMQFSLYAQAVAQLQSLSQDDSLSWFGIAGIHGLPNSPWNGAPPKRPDWFGYCAHGIVIFPTWHRPYLALFEQTLQAQAVQIANQYQVDQAAWINAAVNLRAPYWDWAYPPTNTPPTEIYQDSTLEIIGFDGQNTTIPNPFLSFTFDPPIQWPGPGDQHQVTYRAPGIVERVQSILPEVRDDVFNMMTLIDNWYDFSNHTQRESTPPVANSVETIHDKMHVEIGGFGSPDWGDMLDPAVSAFDPIFWLHHASVDRLICLWQTINPDVWVNNSDDPENGLNSSLIPFWNSSSPPSFYESASLPVQTWTEFNYTYPEFVNLQGTTPEARRQEILDIVSLMYDAGTTNRGSTAAVETDEWYIRIWSNTYGLDGSYTIYVFLGPPTNRPTEWGNENDLVGRQTVFANPKPERCSNCKEHADDLSEGIVTLTAEIEERLGTNESVAEIKKYLSKNLVFRVRKADGSSVPTNRVEGFRASVETIKLAYSERDGVYRRAPGANPIVHLVFGDGSKAARSRRRRW